MNSKRIGVEKNARTDKLYMVHGLRTVFHQLMTVTFTISKRHFLPFSDLTNQEVVIKESISNQGQKVFSALRVIVTLTVCSIQEKL